MRFIVISERGMFLPLAERLQKEGHEVFVYVHDRTRRDLYEGMILERIPTPKDLVGLLDPREDATFIVDGYFPNTGKPEDKELYEARGLQSEVNDLIHPLFQDASKHRVVGAGANLHALHRNRGKQFRVAREADLTLPNHHVCEGLRQARSYLEEAQTLGTLSGIHLENELHPQFGRFDESWPGELAEYLGVPAVGVGAGPLVIEDRIEGIEATEEVWWHDGAPRVLFSSIEQTRIGAGDIGWNCGAMLSLFWRRPLPRAFTPWADFRRWLRAPYSGPVTAKYVVPPGGTPIFRGFHIGWRYDSAFAMDTLRRGPMAKLLTGEAASFEDEYVCATVRGLGAGVTGAGVHGELDKGYWIALREGARGHVTSRSNGPVVVATAAEHVDEGIEECFVRAVRKLQDTRVVGGLYYRTDFEGICQAWRRLCRQGWS